MKYHPNYKGKAYVDPLPSTPEEIEKLESINQKNNGKWKRKTLSEKERKAIKTGKDNPTE